MGFDMSVVDDKGNELDVENGYWRRSIWSGGTQAQRLVDAGMAYWSTGEQEPFPQMPESVEWDDEGNAVGPGAEEYEKALLAHLRKTYDERPGIAAYKLCGTNDGWFVTKEECQSALQLWEAAGCPDVDNGVGDTIPFLRCAAAYGGFRVW